MLLLPPIAIQVSHYLNSMVNWWLNILFREGSDLGGAFKRIVFGLMSSLYFGPAKLPLLRRAL